MPPYFCGKVCVSTPHSPNRNRGKLHAFFCLMNDFVLIFRDFVLEKRQNFPIHPRLRPVYAEFSISERILLEFHASRIQNRIQHLLHRNQVCNITFRNWCVTLHGQNAVPPILDIQRWVLFALPFGQRHGSLGQRRDSVEPIWPVHIPCADPVEQTLSCSWRPCNIVWAVPEIDIMRTVTHIEMWICTQKDRCVQIARFSLSQKICHLHSRIVAGFAQAIYGHGKIKFSAKEALI